MQTIKCDSIGLGYNFLNNQKIEIRLPEYIFLETANLKEYYLISEDFEYKVDNIELANNILLITIDGVTKGIYSDKKHILDIFKSMTSNDFIDFKISYEDTRVEIGFSEKGIENLTIYYNPVINTSRLNIEKNNSKYYLYTYRPLIVKEVKSFNVYDDFVRISTLDDQFIEINLKVNDTFLKILKDSTI